ncbi:MAG: SCO family protein [Paracoccaceae bacterium]
MSRWIISGAVVAAAVAVGVGGWIWLQPGGSDDQFAQCREGVIAGGAGAIGGPFTLVNQSGVTVTDQDVVTEPTLLYFGYTFCPDVCPLDSARNAEALNILTDRGLDAQAAFITVDPARDTPEVVGEFAGMFHPDMMGLTGSAEQVAAAASAYRVYSRIHDEEDSEYYLVDHTTFTYLVMPDTGFQAFFRREDSAEDIANRTACFIENS